MTGPDPRRGADPLELLGRQLMGRYTIRDRIANGGMSVVYRGQDDRLSRPVCVKVFFGLDRSQAVYQTSYEHFIQEAGVLSQLTHPNTLTLYDFGYLEEEPRSPFHVSELMTGGTLLAHIRREGPLPLDEALEILTPIGGALSEAHARGIVHRDIKPTNILFGSAGPRKIVKLADFGIAKAHLEEDERAIPNRAQDTQAASGRRISLYSPGWAAPEQLRALPVGPTADVYALGLLLVFMVTGKKIFSDKDVLETVQRRMEGDSFVAYAVAALELPQPLVEVILHAVRSDPAERYPGAEELLEALREAVRQVGSRELATAKYARMPEAVGGPVLFLSPSTDSEIVAAGRRVRIVPAVDSLDLGGPTDPIQAPARIRLTLLPHEGGAMRLHVKGLSCFVARAGARPSGAVAIESDAELELISPARVRLDVVRCVFGSQGKEARLFPLAGATLAVPTAESPRVVLLDFGPGRELVLVHQPAAPRRVSP